MAAYPDFYSLSSYYSYHYLLCANFKLV